MPRTKQPKTQPPPESPELPGQDLLDALTKLGPQRSLSAAADILDPDSSAGFEFEDRTILGWVKKNLPEMFPIPWGPPHRWGTDQLQAQPYGLRAWEAASRGVGKTSLYSVGVPLACIALGTHHFPIIVGSTQDEADARLEAIRGAIDDSDLQRNWPNLRYVMKRNSIKKRNKDTADEVQLAGGVILVKGAGARIRGIIRYTPDGKLLRPDLAILDDIESEEQVWSKLRTDRLEDWIFAVVGGLSGHQGRPISILGIGTTIGANAICTRAIKNQGRFAKWKTAKFPAIVEDARGNTRPMWPEGLPWGRIKELRDPESEGFVGSFVWAREYMLDPQEANGALWTEEMILKSRYEITPKTPLPKFKKIVVSVDPSWGTKRDECGIVVGGLGVDGIVYLLDDRSVRSDPTSWGRVVAQAYYDWKADLVIAEAAFGAEQVKLVMKTVDDRIPFQTFRSAKDKTRRFEPVVVKYQKGLVRHAAEVPMVDLERQALTYVQGESHFSPDRMDAAAWVVWYFLIRNTGGPAKLYRPSVGIKMSVSTPRSFVR